MKILILFNGGIRLKILIIGGSSIIGSKMLELLKEKKIDVEFTYFQNKTNFKNGHYLDITKKNDVLELMEKINPDVVYHTSALTSIEKCELDHGLADEINVDGVSNLISGCRQINCKIVYVSTAFVFNGEKSSYSESDERNPATYYGYTKAKSESLIQSTDLKYLILRTDALYGWLELWQRENSVTRAISTIKSGKILREVTDWYNTPTYVSDFVNASLLLIEKNKEGIFHVAGSEFINRYDWSLKVIQKFNLEKNIEKINSSELNLSAKRVNINLQNDKLYSELGIKMKNISDGLDSMIKEITS